MVKLATEKVDYFKVSDIEFQLEKPSYTHITLKALSKKYPEHTFQLIIGEDNVAKFDEWKEADWIIENYKVLVYRRQVDHRKNTRRTTNNIRLTHV
jgi:nicotinate-nucleotide adenylyltransferase